jgi:hypothetical protein
MYSNSYTKLTNINNVDNIRKQINQAKQGKYTTSNEVKQIITDYDVFPYPRWYRNEYALSQPIIAEREAGYRPREDQCYSVNNVIVQYQEPNHCFESACSTVYPCYPEYLAKLSDRKAMNVLLNQKCLIENR